MHGVQLNPQYSISFPESGRACRPHAVWTASFLHQPELFQRELSVVPCQLADPPVEAAQCQHRMNRGPSNLRQVPTIYLHGRFRCWSMVTYQLILHFNP